MSRARSGLAVAGLAVAGLALTAAPAQAAAPSRALVLAIDTTDSVQPEEFAAAQAAVQTLIAGLPADVAVGLVPFDDTVHDVVTPPGDRAALDSAVAALSIRQTRATVLYDAISTSLDLAAGYDDSVVIMVTDGEEFPATGVEERLAQAKAEAAVAGATVQAIRINAPDEEVPGDFQELVDATGGTITPVAGGQDLAGDLREGLQQAATRVAAAPDGPPPITLVTDAAPHPDAVPVVAVPQRSPSPLLPQSVFLAAAAAMSVAAVTAGLVVAGLASRASSPQTRRRRAMDSYQVGTARALPLPPLRTTRFGDGSLARWAVGTARRYLRGRGQEDRLALRLEAANISLTPAEWLVIQVAAGIGGGLLLLLLALGNPIALLVGAVVGAAAPVVLLRLRGSRRRKAFHDALPDTLQLLASSLRVGYSLQQALDTVVREGREPVRTEFQRALVDVRLNVPIEQSLEQIADRVESEDFRWVVIAIRIQREVGGNLAEILDTVAETMRERERLRRHVDTLAAEGRLSAIIVGALPVVFALYLLAVQPGYLSPLVTEPIGVLLLVGSLALFAVGVVGLRWATKVEL